MSYEKPVVIQNDSSFEGVYAASGDRFTEGGWNWTSRWGNHDTGSYSTLYIKGYAPSQKIGDNLRCTCTISYIGPSPFISWNCGSMPGNATVSISGSTITISANVNNPNEQLECMFNCYFATEKGSYNNLKGDCTNNPFLASTSGALSMSWS